MGTSNFLFLLSCIITIFPLTTAQFCLNQFNFTANSTFPEARNVLFSSLAANVTARGGFFTATLPQDSDDTLYALGLCRGDLFNETCFNCISAASQAVINNCTNHKEAIALWDHCMVRYSNRSFFNVMDTRPAVFGWVTNNISAYYVDEFDGVLSPLVDELIVRAATGSSTLKFATGDDNYTVFDNRIYAAVQCVPTLSSGDCNNCLRGALDDYTSCCLLRQYVNIWRPSCSFRFQLSPFLDSTVGTAPPPPPSPVTLSLPPPPPTNATGKEGNRSHTSQTAIIIAVPILSITFLLIALACAFLLLGKKQNVKRKYNSGCLSNLAWIRSAANLFRASIQNAMHQAGEDETQSQSMDFLRFDFATVRAATKDFSNGNKLGGGGFGSVYKGQLPNGKEIAVKRLAKGATQGQGEFKNEIVLLARLQHKNLVRLLGFCLEGEERIIVYEFVPNASLDRFIFGMTLVH